MGFDNKYPYTDFHEMNEDWFLLHFKEVMEAVHQNNETVKGLIEYIHSLGLVVIDDNAPALDKVYSSRHTQDLLDDKVDKVTGMGLSQNNFTNTLKNKLDGIEAGANKTVVDDYMAALQTNPVEGGVIYQALNSKVDKVAGKQLSQENYTSTEKTKLAGIAEDATKTEIDDTFNSGLKIGTISINDIDTDLNVPVDDELSNNSTNPLQNKAIYDLIEEILPEVTETGNPISINDAFGFPAKSCEVTFSPIQSGSGDPSPENIRPISGRDSIVLNVSDGESAGTDYNETFTDTVYGGVWKPQEGKAIIDRGYVDLGSLEWTYSTSGQGRFTTTDISNYIYKPSTNSEVVDNICSCYVKKSANQIHSGDEGIAVNTNGTLWIRDTRTTDATVFTGYVSGQYLAYPLDTPTEITLTAEQIALLKGNNTLWTDGDNITLKYSADIKQWVLNQ